MNGILHHSAWYINMAIAILINMSITNENVFKSRIAPTPSGYLHIGNIFSFVLTWIITRQNKGSLLLRIDDMDHQRVERRYVENIFKTLDWLKIDYDQGPGGVSDFITNFTQKSRREIYCKGLDEILSREGTYFYCSCSRKQIKQTSMDGLYPGTCRNISNYQQNSSIRVNTLRHPFVIFQDKLKGKVSIDLEKSIRDFVIWKKDDNPAYQLTSLMDDLHYGINCVIRGNDLIDSTAAQIFLGEIMGRHEFKNSSFLHHNLIMNKGQKLSKSQKSNSILEEFISPKHVYIYIGKLLGMPAIQCESLHTMQENFKLEIDDN